MTPNENYVPEYIEDISRFSLLSDEDQRALAEMVQYGNNDNTKKEARDKLTNHNLRLVVSIARSFLGRGVSLPDLIQEGNDELYRVSGTYDPFNSAKFSTYAGTCIRGRLKTLIREQRNPIHLPHNLPDLQKQWSDAMSKLEAKLGMPPSEEEIRDELRGDEKQSESLSDRLRKARIVNQGVGNLDSMILVGEHRFVGGYGDKTSPQEEILKERELRQLIIDYANTYEDKRAVRAFMLRFGLGAESPKVLSEVATQIEVSKQAITKMLDRVRDHIKSEMKRNNIDTWDLENRNDRYQRI